MELKKHGHPAVAPLCHASRKNAELKAASAGPTVPPADQGEELSWLTLSVHESVHFLGVVDRVFGNLDGDVGLCQYGLAAQAGVGLQSPGAVEQIFFGFIKLVE